MPIDTKNYQTVVLPKSELEPIKLLAKKVRLPITKVVLFALRQLLEDKDARRKLMEEDVA